MKNTTKLFVFESELQIFKVRHPEYNHFEEQKDDFEELIDYNALVVEENNN